MAGRTGLEPVDHRAKFLILLTFDARDLVAGLWPASPLTRVGTRGAAKVLADGAGEPVVRSDNRLIFQSRRFRAACWDYRLRYAAGNPGKVRLGADG